VEKVFHFLGEVIREFYEKCFHYQGFINTSGYYKNTIIYGTYDGSGDLVWKMLKRYNVLVSSLNAEP